MEKRQVVDDWKDAVVVPIPKKGNLQLCDNWRGISLLDIVGKILPESFKNVYRSLQNIPCRNLSVASEKEEDVWI